MEKKNESTPDDSQTAKQGGQSEPGTGAALETTKPAVHHLGADQYTKDHREKLKTWIPIAGLVISTFAAIASAFSARGSWAVLDANIKRDRLDQRAWVGIIKHGEPTEIVPDVGHFWYFLARNSGKTPALSVKYIATFWAETKGERFVPVYPSAEPVKVTSVTVFQPGERQWLMGGPLPVRRETLEMLKNGTALLYIYGQIQYDDVFGDIHCTMFCYALNSDLQHLNAYEKYNEVSDTKCENID